MAADLAQMIDAARSGDADAFEALYDRFERSIYAFCRQLLDDPAAAEDACQQTFVDAWQNLPRLRHTAAFTTWLRQGALTACRRHRRHRRRERPLTEAFEDEPPEPADDGDEPGDALSRRETIRQVRAAIAKLSPAHREVVVMHHLQGWRLDEIAATLQVAEGTVKSRLGRAREHLERLLRGTLEQDHET